MGVADHCARECLRIYLIDQVLSWPEMVLTAYQVLVDTSCSCIWRLSTVFADGDVTTELCRNSLHRSKIDTYSVSAS